MSTEQGTSDIERNGAQAPDGAGEAPQNWLRDYEMTKFELAGLIREASAAAWQAKQEKLQRDFQAVLKRLAEDRFYLTLAGQFSRGKTSLLNAMLGLDRLPTGVVPVTSVITVVSYNPTERIVMHFENSNLTHEVPLAELPEWITERGNPANERKIDMAEVQLPAELLRRGAFFVDTPGLGSAVIENTATTHRFLPHIDALVLVTSFEFPLSQEEVVFMRKARALRRKTFVVINKLDLCSPRHQSEVLDFIRLRMAEEGSAEEIVLFSVSASEALAAKLGQDEERLNRSGLPAFERALVDYLVKDRYHDFLTATCDRIESLLTTQDVPGLKELEDRLEGVRSKILTQEHKEHHPTRASDVVPTQSLNVSSCFLCKRMADATFKFLSQFQYALSHSREEQVFHASTSGFCSLHTREYARLASPQGIASGYPRTLLFMAEHLRLLSHEDRLGENWRDQFQQFLPDYRKCRACQAVRETEEATMNDFVREYEAAAHERNADLPCACLRHLYGILQRASTTELTNRLLLRSAAALERTAENMERFALRHGGHHMELATDEELGSPEKGLNLLVGQPNVRPAGSY